MNKKMSGNFIHIPNGFAYCSSSYLITVSIFSQCHYYIYTKKIYTCVGLYKGGYTNIIYLRKSSFVAYNVHESKEFNSRDCTMRATERITLDTCMKRNVVTSPNIFLKV